MGVRRAPLQWMLHEGEAGSVEVDADQRSHDQGRAVRDAQQRGPDAEPPDEDSPLSAPIYEDGAAVVSAAVSR